MIFRVQKGIPIPEKPISPKFVYPWETMEEGDSFLIPKGGARELRNAATAGGQFCKRHRPKLRCIVRTISSGIRVWLVKRSKPRSRL